MTDKNSLLASAQKYLAAGKIHLAVGEYLKLLKENPNDRDLMIQIGDLFLRVNHVSRAIEYFEMAAKLYCAKGFFQKAIALYGRMKKLAPDRTDLLIKLAELHSREGHIIDARNELQEAIQQRLKDGQLLEAAELMNALIEMEPENLLHSWDLAQVYEKLEMNSQAAGIYFRIAKLMREKGLVNDRVKPLEKARSLHPKNPAILWELFETILQIYKTEPQELENFLSTSTPETFSLLAKGMPLEEFEGTVALLDRAFTYSLQKQSLQMLKGRFCMKKGYLDAALSEFLKAAQGDRDKSIELCRKITRVDCSFYPAWLKLIEFYGLASDQENLVDASSSLADAYISKTMYPEAARCLDRLIRMDPQNQLHSEKKEFVLSLYSETDPDLLSETGTADEFPVFEIRNEDLGLSATR